MNALKHGMRSKRLALLDEESYAFETRRMKWMSITDPDDDMGEFLVDQCVSLSFELERAQRADVERLTSLIENSDESEFDAVHELGKRLFFDPTGPTPMYGNRPDGRRKLRTSWNGQAVDPNDPAVLARQLESSAMGCCWMRDCWDELRAQLEPGKFWQSHDRLKAIRLLGRQPLDAVEDRQVAEIFVASSALDPAGHKPFDDLLSDMGTTEHVHYRKAVRARWPDLVSAEDTARCRQILIDLADRNIERLNAKLEVHEQNADANAQRTVDRLGFDQSPDSNRIRQYKLKCNSGFFRAFETYRKYQAKKRAEGGERRIEYGGPRGEDSRRKIPDAARWPQPMAASDHVPDRSFEMGDREREALEQPIDSGAWSDRGAQPGCGTDTASAIQPASADAMAETAVPDGITLSSRTSALTGVTLSDDITRPEGSALDAAAGNAGANSPDVSAADAAVQRGVATSPQGENSENATDEAKLAESVSIRQSNEPVGVAANSGVDSGLDKREERAEGGGLRTEVGGRTIGHAGRWAREMDASDHVPDGSFVVEDGEREALEQSIDSDTSPDPGAQRSGDGISPRGENSENETNEANFDESVIVIQNKESVGVAANSGLDSGLDKREEPPGRAEGKEEGLNQEKVERRQGAIPTAGFRVD